MTKWYVPETDSAAALALRSRFRPPLVLSHLHRLELVTAWQLKVFRREMGAPAAAGAIADLLADIAAGVWLPPGYDLPRVYDRAEQLSRAHASALGARTLDVLHVAAALELGAADFVTADHRQGRLAATVGLVVTRP